MKVFIAGGTGFIGHALIHTLLAQGHQATALARNPEKMREFAVSLRVIPGSPSRPGPWQQEVPGHDVVVNLTGANIFTRWTAEAKKLILESRVAATRNIVAALPEQADSPLTLINGSASGYYGFSGDEEKYETDPPGSDFLATVCQAWEKEAASARSRARVITLRTGVVLGRNGGALAKMLPAFRLGVAGRLGSGRQWFPWIHQEDLCRALLFLMENQDIQGPINLCSPQPVRNAEFTAILGKVLHRPTVLPLPAFAARLALGELATVVLEGCRMMPGVLRDHGFAFRFPGLEEALRDLLAAEDRRDVSPITGRAERKIP